MHDLKIFVSSIKGTGAVDFREEGSVLFVRHIAVNDHEIHSDESEFRLSVDGSSGFLTLEIHDPPEEVSERFAADDYLDGTDEDVLLLPVRSVAFLEAPVFVT